MSNLQDWRNSFRLIPNNDIVTGACKKGQTFRTTSRHASVEFGQSSTDCGSLTGGTAKPGPTAIRDSSLVRRRKIQVRTKSNKIGNSGFTDKFERTFRGYNSHVENGRDGYGVKMTLSVSQNKATSATSATITHVAGSKPLVVGDKLVVTGHTGNAANLAMNQTFTVASVTNSTTAVLTGAGMTAATYNSGTIIARVVSNVMPYAQLFGHENRYADVPQAGVRGDASDVIYFKPIFERLKLDVISQ